MRNLPYLNWSDPWGAGYYGNTERKVEMSREEAIKYLNQYALSQYSSQVKSVAQKTITLLESPTKTADKSEPASPIGEQGEFTKECRQYASKHPHMKTAGLNKRLHQACDRIDRLEAENKRYHKKMTEASGDFLKQFREKQQLQAEIKELKKDRDAHSKIRQRHLVRCGKQSTCIEELQADLRLSEQENEKLVVDLKHYGVHSAECKAEKYPEAWHCICGLEQALSPKEE